MYKITIMAVEPLVSDSLTDVSTPRHTNCEEINGKMPWLSKNLLRVCILERAEQNMFYLCVFSYLYPSTSLDYSVVNQMEIRHNNYADCFINRGRESSADQ